MFFDWLISEAGNWSMEALFPLATALSYWFIKLLSRRFAQSYAGTAPPFSEAVAWTGVDFVFLAIAVSIGAQIPTKCGFGDQSSTLWYLFLCALGILSLWVYAEFLRNNSKCSGWWADAKEALLCWVSASVGILPLLLECRFLADRSTP